MRRQLLLLNCRVRPLQETMTVWWAVQHVKRLQTFLRTQGSMRRLITAMARWRHIGYRAQMANIAEIQRYLWPLQHSWCAWQRAIGAAHARQMLQAGRLLVQQRAQLMIWMRSAQTRRVR